MNSTPKTVHTKIHQEATSIKRIDSILIVIFLIILLCCVVVSSISSLEHEKKHIEEATQEHFNNWNHEQYTNWTCSDMSSACKSYIRDTLGYPTVLVYGSAKDFTAHKWILVYINNAWYEFESTLLTFQETSNQFGSRMFTQLFKEIPP